MGASRTQRTSFPSAGVGRGWWIRFLARSGTGVRRDGAAGPFAARRGVVTKRAAAALAIGLLMGAPAAVDGRHAWDILVRLEGFGFLSRGNEDGGLAWPARVLGSDGAESRLPAFPGANAAALVLATTAHTVTVRRSTGGEVGLGRVSLPSPVLRLQYDFLPERRFNAYAGAGIGAPFFDQQNTANRVHDETVSGYALGAGVDVKISESWSVNIDAQKVFLDGGTTEPGKGVTAREEDLDPWVFGVGFGSLF